MSSRSKTLQEVASLLLQRLAYEDYQSADIQIKQLLQIISLEVGADPYLWDNGVTERLFNLKGTIPITAGRKSKSDVPVCIWLPLQFPSVSPRCYVTPVHGRKIKSRHLYVGPTGFISHPYLNSWKDTSNLVELVGILSSVFKKDPPPGYSAISVNSKKPAEQISVESEEKSFSPSAFGRLFGFKLWLSDNVHLPQYYNAFESNGFAELALLRHIDEGTLIDTIGMNKPHRKLFLERIQPFTQFFQFLQYMDVSELIHIFEEKNIFTLRQLKMKITQKSDLMALLHNKAKPREIDRIWESLDSGMTIFNARFPTFGALEAQLDEKTLEVVKLKRLLTMLSSRNDGPKRVGRKPRINKPVSIEPGSGRKKRAPVITPGGSSNNDAKLARPVKEAGISDP